MPPHPYTDPPGRRPDPVREGEAHSVSSRALGRMVRLAARLLEAPVAAVMFLVDGRLELAAAHGSDLWDPALSENILDSVLASGTPHLIEDAATDPDLADANLATGIMAFRACALAPLPARETKGTRTGLLGVFYPNPRQFPPGTAATIQELAALVADEVESGSAVSRSRDELAQLEARVRERTAELGRLNGTLRQHVQEQERAEAAARRSESKFRALIENAQDLISVLTPDGVILYQSPSIEHLLGYPPDDLIGRNLFQDLLHPDDHAVQRRCAEQIVDEGAKYVRAELRYRHRDGSWRLLESVSSITPADSPVVGLVVNSRDITDRRRTELEHEARRREQTALAELGRFALDRHTLEEIFQRTAEIVTVALQVPFCTINEAVGGEEMFVRAAVGWEPGPNERMRQDPWGSHLPLAVGGRDADLPELVVELPEAVAWPGALFSLPPTGGQPPCSAARVVIHCDGRRFGTVQAYSPQPGRFHAHDVTFLQTIADMISTIVESERHLAASRQQEARFQRIVENMPGMVYQLVLSPDGRFSTPFVSDGCRQIFGREATELAPDPGAFGALIEKHDREVLHQAILASAQSLEPFEWDGRLLLDDGAVRWVTARARPERQAGGGTIWEGLLFDVSALVEAREAIQAAKEEAEQANNAKSAFLSRMSHELRTPLNSILGFGQLLEIEQLSPRQQASVEHIVKGGRHLLELINEVLDITRIESGAMELHLEAVDVGELLDEALRFTAPLAGQCGVHYAEPAACSSDGLGVVADRGRLRQILLNLLSNAVKYNREGGEVQICCSQPDAGTVRIDVRDTGLGLEPDEIEKIFTPFERLGRPQCGQVGSGIGLTTAKSLARVMGGSIRVESTPGVGSTFSIDLPAAAGAVRPRPQKSAAPDPSRRPAELAFVGGAGVA